MFHIILHCPEIPANTGNVIRLCANAGCRLHLIRPLGFRLDMRSVRRAALDYAELASVRTHDSLAACLRELSYARVFAVETGAGRRYSEARFEPGDALLFGSETRGLPGELVQALAAEQRLCIPMHAGNRSLNLANAVALVAYEAWRQNDFASAARPVTRIPA